MLCALFAFMRFRLFASRFPVNRRRLVLRRFLPRPLRWLLIALLLAVLVLAGLASRWGVTMMEHFGWQQQSQAQLARLQQDMLVLQHQLQAQSAESHERQEPAAVVQSQVIAEPKEAAEPLPLPPLANGFAASRQDLEAVNALALVDEATQQALRQQVKELQLENQHLKNELSFYENLLPADDKSGLSIRGFTAERRGDDALGWQLLLMQLKRDAGTFKGELEWLIVGELDGKPWRLPANQRRQAIDMQSYQRLEGRLRIPAQLQLSSVTVVVWQGKNERARQSIAFDNDPETGAQETP